MAKNEYKVEVLANATLTLHTHADVPVLLCGDFNNTPDSPIYKYMTDCFLGAKGQSATTIKDCCGDEVAFCLCAAYTAICICVYIYINT